MKRINAIVAGLLILVGCASQNKSNENENVMVTGFGHVALMTPEFDATIRFYQEVFGAEDLGQFGGGKCMCWLKIGDDILEVCETDGGRADGYFDHIAISCTDVDAVYEAALKAGGEGQVQPKDIRLELKKPREARIAFVRGINGERIELFSVIPKK